jgi:hypothetical protein
MSMGSSGGADKRAMLCTSPPQVREYERDDAERKQPSNTHNGTPIQFNNLKKKCRTPKKNFPMVARCIRAAKCCRKLMKRVSVGKRTDGKATKDHGDSDSPANGKTLECGQKESLESSSHHLLSSEKEFNVSAAVLEESCEMDRKEEDPSTHGLIASLAWTSIDSDEELKEDDLQPVSLKMVCANDIPCVSSVVAESDTENEGFDQQSTSLVSKVSR